MSTVLLAISTVLLTLVISTGLLILLVISTVLLTLVISTVLLILVISKVLPLTLGVVLGVVFYHYTYLVYLMFLNISSMA